MDALDSPAGSGPGNSTGKAFWTLFLSCLMVIAAVACFLGIRAAGQSLVAPPAAVDRPQSGDVATQSGQTAKPSTPGPSILPHVLFSALRPTAQFERISGKWPDESSEADSRFERVHPIIPDECGSNTENEFFVQSRRALRGLD